MSSNSTMTEVRSVTQPPSTAEDAGRAPSQAPTQGRKGSRLTTILLSLAGLLAAALYLGSLVVLSDAADSANKLESWGGPAALSAMIALYAVIAAFALLFTAAFRSTNQG